MSSFTSVIDHCLLVLSLQPSEDHPAPELPIFQNSPTGSDLEKGKSELSRAGDILLPNDCYLCEIRRSVVSPDQCQVLNDSQLILAANCKAGEYINV